MTAVKFPGTASVMSDMLAGVRVLVVEDEPTTLALLEQLLTQAGAVATLTRDADEAVAKLEAVPHDVIVSGVSTPTGDGYRLIRRVRARSRDRGGATPAIALTDPVGETDHTRALLAGFQLHLCKPITAMELTSCIRQLLVGSPR